MAGSTVPATEIEGEWRMVSGSMNGVPMEDSLVQWVKRVTQGNVSTVLAGPQVMLKVEFTCDPSQAPRAIDYLNLAGPHKGKKQQGIYRSLKADLARSFACPAPGTARPTKFPHWNRATAERLQFGRRHKLAARVRAFW